MTEEYQHPKLLTPHIYHAVRMCKCTPPTHKHKKSLLKLLFLRISKLPRCVHFLPLLSEFSLCVS